MASPTVIIDTALPQLLLGLWHQDQFTYIQPNTQALPNQHASRFFDGLDELLAPAQLTPADVKGLAINLGPGSFTGLRVGLAFAKTLASVSPITCYGLNTFQLVASCPTLQGKTVAILLNAYRARHYVAALRVDDRGQQHWSVQPHISPNAELALGTDIDTWVIEDSLMPLLQVQFEHATIQPVLLSTLSPAFSESYSFLLTQQAPALVITAQQLQPLYMQEPHISKPKGAKI